MTAAAPPPLAADLTEACGAETGRDAPARPERLRPQDPAWHPKNCCAPWSRPRSAPATPPQRPHPHESRRFPGDQDPDDSTWACPRSRRPPSPTWPRWNGSRPGRLCLVGPAGTGKSHLRGRARRRAVAAGHKVRYYTAAELTETLYRGLADNSVGRIIDTLLRNDLILIDEVGFAPLDDTGAQLLFRVVARLRTPRPGIASHWPSNRGAGSCPSTPPPSACSTGCCTTPASWSPTAILPHASSQRPGKGTTLNKT